MNVTPAAAAPQLVANMILPAGGMESWTQIMYGTTPVPDEINTGSPIVIAWALFDDGTRVAGGVYKSTTPTDFNVKFMWVTDAGGTQYAGWPIDVTDEQDFLTLQYNFSLPGSSDSYQLNIVET
jgi:hypothetical protein